MSARQKIALFIVGGTLLGILIALFLVAWVLHEGPVSDVQLPTI